MTLVLPFALGIGAALGALLADGWGSQRLAVRVAAFTLLAAAAAAAWSVSASIAEVMGFTTSGAGIAALQSACFALAGTALLAGMRELSRRPHGGQIAALVAFSATASVALIGATGLVALLLLLEAIALAGYALVAASRTSASDEAALKYFVQGSIATALLVYGIGALAAMESVGDVSGRAALVAATLLACALAFKVGAFPFHAWVPDAYEAAPPSVAAFLAAVPKLAALLALAALFGPGEGRSAAFPETAGVFALLALGSIVFGNLAALRQTSFARMLGYSAVAQTGYALVALVSSVPVAAVAAFGITYAIGALGAFAAVQALRDGHPEWDGSVRGLAGLGKRAPALAGAIAVLMLSFTGIPLTAGFWGKMTVFAAALGPVINGGTGWGVWVSGMRIDGLWLVVVGVVGSVVSFGYYGAVLRAAFIDPDMRGLAAPRDDADEVEAGAGRLAGGVAIAAAVGVLVLGIAPFAIDLGTTLSALALR